ncbi:MAG TPA: hypothetical protein VF489_09365 [Sphingobium sp.]
MKTEEFTGVERLAALHEIKLLKARRDRAADTKDWALYESLHAPDHHSWNEDYPPTTTAAESFCRETYEKQKGSRPFTSRMVTRTHAHTSTGAQSAPIPGR